MLPIRATCISSFRLVRWFIVLASFIVTLTSQVALGHTLLVTQGEVVVEECRASVELDVAFEDLVHWYGVGPDSNGFIPTRALADIVERHALALHRIFMIRDSAGIPLPSEPFGVHFEPPADTLITLGTLRSLRAKYTTTFSYPRAPRFLTFQLLMGNDCPSVFWQTLLSVHGGQDEGGRVLRLTSRGNAETVELLWRDERASLAPSATQGDSCSGEGAASLKQICADIHVGTETIEAQITIPLTLLQTWLVQADHDEGSLTPDEQKSATSEIRSLLADALSVESQGRKYSGDILGITFLPLEARNRDSPVENQRVSLLTGRVKALIRFGPFATLEQTDFQWNLFNNAVLSVSATFDGSDPVVRHEFSTYQPKYHWQRRP